MSAYAVQIGLTNEDKGYTFSEWVDTLDPDTSLPRLFHADDTLNTGALFRLMRAEYGRCTSSIYVDTPTGVRRVGWYFVSRQEYEDWRGHGDRYYLRGAWVTMLEPRGDYQPTRYQPLTLLG